MDVDAGSACEESDLYVAVEPESMQTESLAACTSSLSWSRIYPPEGESSVLTVADGCLLGQERSTDLVMSRLPDMKLESIVPITGADVEYLNAWAPFVLVEVAAHSYPAVPVLYWTMETEDGFDVGLSGVDPETGETIGWLELPGNLSAAYAAADGLLLVGSDDRERNVSQIDVYSDIAEDGLGTPIARSTGTLESRISDSIDPVGDVDGDGTTDVVVFNVDGRPALVFGPDLLVDEGVHGSVRLAGQAVHSLRSVVAIGDADGDGHGDIAAKSETEDVGSPNGIAIIDGGANEVGAQIYDDRVGTWSLGEAIFSPGDLDGDGGADLVTWSRGGDSPDYINETWVFSIPDCGSHRLTDIASQIEAPANGLLIDSGDRALLWSSWPDESAAAELSLMLW